MSKLIFNGKECPENEFVDIYYPNGTLLAHTNNDLEFHWLLKEIGIQNEDGYYLIFHGEKISIDKYGVLDYQPSGCMDNIEKIIEEKHNIHTNCISKLNSNISDLNVSNKLVNYKEFDLVLYKPTNEEGIVKSVVKNGAFILFQPTAKFCLFKDLVLL